MMKLKKPITLIFGSVLLTGCACSELQDLVSKRLTQSDLDFNLITPEIIDPDPLILTLDDVLEIALCRNLDLLVKNQEWAIQHEKDTGEALKLLPSLIASGVTSYRNKSTASTQQEDGTISSPIVSSQQRVEQWDITATWNLLDFGVTYYRSRQEHERAQVIAFQYRRLEQNLVLDVYKAYWRAIAALQAVKNSQNLIELSKQQQAAILQQVQDRNLSQFVGLKSELQLVDIQVRLNKFQSEYENSKAELAGLMGISPFVCYELAPVQITDVNPDITDLCELESLALWNRPELYVTDLTEKIAEDEVRAAVLQLLPSPALFAGRNYDHDKFLLHHYWTLTGIRASWNLLALPSRYYDVRSAQGQKCLAKFSRLALSVGVLTQVNIAYITYLDASENFELMDRLAVINEKLLETAKAMAENGEISIAEIITYRMNALVARIDAWKAYGDLRTALELLNNTVGLPRYFHNSQVISEDLEISDSLEISESLENCNN